MASLLQRAIDAHQYRLSVGSPLAPVAVAVLADHHCRTNRSLGVVVVEGNIRVVQERQQVVAMTPQPFDQTLRLRVVPRRGDQLVQADGQARTPRGVLCGGDALSLLEPDR